MGVFTVYLLSPNGQSIADSLERLPGKAPRVVSRQPAGNCHNLARRRYTSILETSPANGLDLPFAILRSPVSVRSIGRFT
jgi:hypothetical protein